MKASFVTLCMAVLALYLSLKGQATMAMIWDAAVFVVFALRGERK